MTKIEYNNDEKEILILKATMDSIYSMVNYEVLSINDNENGANIGFPTITHRQYFNILLIDFISQKIFGIEKTCLNALQDIINSPQYNTNIQQLKNATSKFQEWLDNNVKLNSEGQERTFWFPTINQNIALKITRSEFISICGNISKHNNSGLDRQAKKIQQIFKRSEIEIDKTEALLLMEEFYEQFHYDLFAYHSSAIAEFLNNIRWEIYKYLQPLYKNSVEYFYHTELKDQSYRYKYPTNIKDRYVKTIFWNLMNDVRSEPCINKFKCNKFLKTFY